MEQIDQPKSESSIWFYEVDGVRKGGVSDDEIVHLIKNGIVISSSLVWKSGFTNWIKLSDSELNVHIDNLVPPPLLGTHVNNNIVWVLSFAPLIGLFLEGFIAAVIYHGNEYLVDKAIDNAEFWYVTIILNVILSALDNKRLMDAGHNTDRFSKWVWLVPIYLFQRSKMLNHNYSYFIVWVVCFLIFFSS